MSPVKEQQTLSVIASETKQSLGISSNMTDYFSKKRRNDRYHLF